MSDKKIGRPKSENPKVHRITVRLDDETWDALKQCQLDNDVTISRIIRDGIIAVYQDAGRFDRNKK